MTSKPSLVLVGVKEAYIVYTYLFYSFNKCYILILPSLLASLSLESSNPLLVFPKFLWFLGVYKLIASAVPKQTAPIPLLVYKQVL